MAILKNLIYGKLKLKTCLKVFKFFNIFKFKLKKNLIN